MDTVEYMTLGRESALDNVRSRTLFQQKEVL